MKRKPVRTVGGSSHLTKKVGNPSTVTNFSFNVFQMPAESLAAHVEC